MQAVINVAIAPLTTNPALWAQNPQQSRLVDELLLGMPVEITGEAEQHMVPVRTFYGYTGWVAQDALLTGPKAEEWLVQPQMVVIARWADVLAEPRVQGACVAAGLPLGARVAVQGEPEDGWQAVALAGWPHRLPACGRAGPAVHPALRAGPGKAACSHCPGSQALPWHALPLGRQNPGGH